MGAFFLETTQGLETSAGDSGMRSVGLGFWPTSASRKGALSVKEELEVKAGAPVSEAGIV